MINPTDIQTPDSQPSALSYCDHPYLPLLTSLLTMPPTTRSSAGLSQKTIAKTKTMNKTRRNTTQNTSTSTTSPTPTSTSTTTTGPIYFWKPEQENGYLGQWYPSPFTATLPDGTRQSYENAEQYVYPLPAPPIFLPSRSLPSPAHPIRNANYIPGVDT